MQEEKSCLFVKHPSMKCPCWRIVHDCDYFHLVKTLSDSGIAVYFTGTQHEHDQIIDPSSDQNYAMVIDNAKSCEFLAVNVINQLAKCKTTCPRCLKVMSRAQDILNYYDRIKKNNIIGICASCSAMGRKKPSCDKCADVTQKYRAWKRRYLKGIAEPGDSRLWLKQIDDALRDMVEPSIDREKRDYSDRDFFTIEKVKKPSLEVLLDSKASKARSFIDHDLEFDKQQQFVKKSEDRRDKMKEFQAISYDNLAPKFTTSERKTDSIRVGKDDLQAMSDSALQVYKRGVKKSDISISKIGKKQEKDSMKDIDMAISKKGKFQEKDSKKDMGLSKISKLQKKDSKKTRDQVSSSTDSEEKNKLSKKTIPLGSKLKHRSLKSMKSTKIGPQSSVDLEIVKHRKLRKHHSLDTFLTSIDKKQKNAKKNFVYLFPEELKKKSKSTDTLGMSSKKKMKAKIQKERDHDGKRKQLRTDRDSKKDLQSSVEDIPQGNLFADWKKNRDLKSELPKKEKDLKNYRSNSEFDEKDGKSGMKKPKVKSKDNDIGDDQDKEDLFRDKEGRRDKKRKESNETDLSRKDNKTKDNLSKETQIIVTSDKTNKKEQLQRKLGKGDEGKQTPKNAFEDTDKKSKNIQSKGEHETKHDDSSKDKQHEEGRDKYASKKGADTSARDKGKDEYGSKQEKSTETGKREKKKQLESQEEQFSKSAKRVNENESQLHKVHTEVAKSGKDKIKTATRGIKEDNSESKHGLGVKTAKLGKEDNDLGSKQDLVGEVGKRGKGKGTIDGKEGKERGQGKSDGDKRQKGNIGKNNDAGNRRGKYKDVDGKPSSKKQHDDSSTKKTDGGLDKQKGKAGEGDIGDSLKKGALGKRKGSIQGKPGGDKEKAKRKSRTSDLLLKQIRGQRSALDNRIALTVKVKESDKNKKQKPLAADVEDVLKKLNRSKILLSDEDFSTFGEVVCEQKSESKHEFIVGEIITDIKPVSLEEKNVELRPILFSTKIKDEVEEKIRIKEANDISILPKVGKDETSGITHYALSDKQFIDMGWTMLPTEKVVRKMNVYRMHPAHPEFDWFERNKNKPNLCYDTGEKMAEFDEDGHGRLFYRNGRLALDYYEAEEVNAQQRYVIYGNGEVDHRGRPRPVSVLAMFDYLGNGVVLDNAGKIRLKYNQAEGVILDKSLGPVSHWKWHTLDDPPVLQQVMIDTHLSHKDQNILLIDTKSEHNLHPDNEDMLAIEFDNFIKEKSKKLAQTFKPFQIKMKALKINEYFSLKVLDQASVYLIYRDGTTNIKLNIGMKLDHKEIVDTDTAELGDVSNNIERFPARTSSLEGIQRSVAHAQCVEAARVGLERRLKPPVPVASADILAAATSKPPRTQLRVAPATNYCRKNTCPNFYYETRII